MKKVFLIAILILSTLISNAQVFFEGGGGLTNLYPSAELQAGYRVKNIVSSVGYIVVVDSGEPSMFNLRTGYFFREQLYVYGGFVHVNYKQYDPRENWNTGQIGMQYHFGHGIKGTYYVGSTYSFNKSLSFTLGMSFNLSKGLPCNL
jgi:hypothetical protein